MKRKIEHYGKITGGKLHIHNRDVFQADIETFGDCRSVRITVEVAGSKRSVAQNRLWWLFMTILAKHTGYSTNEMHEICKFKFLKQSKVDEATGQVFEYLGTTTTLTRSQFSDLIEELIQWAAQDLNCILPAPNSQLTIELT